MARPKGTKKLKRIDYIQLKLEHDHKVLIEQKATSLGMSLSSFIRSKLIEACTK